MIMHVFPDKWLKIPLGKVTFFIKGKKPRNSGVQNTQRTVPYINIKAFETGEPDQFAEPGDYPFCQEKDVLIVWDGARAGLVGRGVKGYIGSTLAKCRCDIATKDYLYYFLLSKYNFINSRARGVGIPHVDPIVLQSIEFPIPPENEQHRIVAKIEELFSELDKGVESLTMARKQLALYRQSLLKHAFAGKLTEKWRAKHAGRLETADQLLARIKKEREKRYQQQLAWWQKTTQDWINMGRKGRKPSKPKKNEVLYFISKDEIKKLASLPHKWRWVPLEGVSINITDGDHQAPPQSEKGIPFIVISNIKNNSIDFSKTKFVPETYYNLIYDKRKPKFGDILYTVTGSFGIPCLVNFHKKFCFQRHIALIRLEKCMINKFVYYFLQSRIAFVQANSIATGTAQKTVPLKGLRLIKIPLPGRREQEKIVAELESQFTFIDKTEVIIDQAIINAKRLRQSILKKAFSGQLVPQDSNDEPASELLARIREEREKIQQETRKRPRKRRKKKEVKTMANLLEIVKAANDWLSAQDAFRQCGIGDGAKTDAIEKIYEELRDNVNNDRIAVERRGDEDWLRAVQRG